MNKSFTLSRRQFLESAALMASGAMLSGCVRHIPTGKLPSVCPDSPLTIDVHCHFFNGTDLQLQSFLQKVPDATEGNQAEQAAAPLLKDLNWSVAPTGKSEMKSLLKGKNADLNEHRTASYSKFREEVKRHPVEAEAASSGSKLNSRQRPTAKRYKDYVEKQKGESPKAAASDLIGGTFPAIKEYFQYRYVALTDYLDLYNGPDELSENRTIDLVIAHLVDYDWPLNNGKPTRTKLNDQVKLMELISILSKGRVHTFAPFDPFREIAYQARIRPAKWSAMDALKYWIGSCGCIGVKLYPPMGFAPYGNCTLDPELWKTAKWKWLCDVRSVPDGKGGHARIGERLDDVLGELYHWCLDNDVPLMAHTDLSNGLNKEFNQFPAAKHWAALRAEFGGLRVNFGHMGDLEKTSPDDWNISVPPTPNVNARDLAALMSPDSSALGGRFFADSGFNEQVLSNPNHLLDVYCAALSWKAPSQSRPVLQDRMMYGSDWSLLMIDENMQSYFADFVQMYKKLEAAHLTLGESSATLSDRFFGWNAVEYLGLRDGRTRDRLNNFYRDKNVKFGALDQPAWTRKIKA